MNMTMQSTGVTNELINHFILALSYLGVPVSEGEYQSSDIGTTECSHYSKLSITPEFTSNVHCANAANQCLLPYIYGKWESIILSTVFVCTQLMYT